MGASRNADKKGRQNKIKRSRRRWRNTCFAFAIYSLAVTCVLVSLYMQSRANGTPFLLQQAAKPAASAAALDITPAPTVAAAETAPSSEAVALPDTDALLVTVASEAATAPLEQMEDNAVPLAAGAANTEEAIRVTKAYVYELSARLDGYPDMLCAIFRNQFSGKTLVSARVAFIGRDASGELRSIATPYRDNSLVFIGSVNDINVAPGETFGAKYGWRLSAEHGLASVEACILSADFADGTQWWNPEYAKWQSGAMAD